jgi:branched-chain amino acid transport system ATP-binding protein
MNPSEVESLGVFLKGLQKGGTTIFIIEHNMKFIMSIAERIIVLNAGEKFREGIPTMIQSDKQVQKIYLGEEEEG